MPPPPWRPGPTRSPPISPAAPAIRRWPKPVRCKPISAPWRCRRRCATRRWPAPPGWPAPSPAPRRSRPPPPPCPVWSSPRCRRRAASTKGDTAMKTDVAGGERYRTDRLLGVGAMATVYLGRDAVLDRVVAIKVLAENLAADDGFRLRFLREARLAARLCHPNLVQVFDAGDDGDRPYLVMEYVEG